MTSSLSANEQEPFSEGWTVEAQRQFDTGLRILARMIAADILKKRSQKNAENLSLYPTQAKAVD